MKVIILAGGSGTRLWPLSREGFPKQFVKFSDGEQSLFQQCFNRSLLLTDINDVYVVTSARHRFLVIADIEELGYKFSEDNIVVEPEAKNTLPAIYAGIFSATKTGHSTIAIFPSDHLITKNNEFVDCIKRAEELSESHLVTFGIKPTYPNTGYGYICPGIAADIGYLVHEFKEKPDYETAVIYMNKGYYWNSGIFLLNSKVFFEEVQTHAPEIAQAFSGVSSIAEAFSHIKTKISIDYGVLEKSERVAFVPCDFGWDDLGGFDSLYDKCEKDEKGNVADAQTLLIGSTNNLMRSDTGRLIAAIGVENMIVIDNRDALLLCRRDQSQKVREVVDVLKRRQDSRAESHATDYRSWGHYTKIEELNGVYNINRIVVNPGKRLEFQLYCNRSKHLIVVKGTALVCFEDESKLVVTGKSVLIKTGQKHYLENVGNTPLDIIEVVIIDCITLSGCT